MKAYTVTWPHAALVDTVTPPYVYEIQMPDTLTLPVSQPVLVQAKDRKTGEDYFGIHPDLNLLVWTDETGERIGSFFEWTFSKNIAAPPDQRIQITKYVTTYSLLNNGKIHYIPDRDNPQTPTPIPFFIEDAYEVPGEHVMLYTGQPTQLHIRIPEPKEIWPTLRDRDSGNPDNRNIKEGIHVLLIESTGIPDHDVEITVQMILPSGGHDHTNQPPLEMRGLLTATGGTTATGNGEVTARTNAQGGIIVTHAAPEFGGRFELIARAQVQGKILEDRDTLTVRVPELMELPESGYYELVGAPDNHSGTNDPCRTTSPQSDHHSNHWGTENLIWAIRGISAKYFLINDNVRLRINDMSLEYGGLFDCNNDWEPPHRSHRTGKNADIGFTGINSYGHCTSLNRSRLEQFFTEQSVLNYTESDHYHITTN